MNPFGDDDGTLAAVVQVDIYIDVGVVPVAAASPAAAPTVILAVSVDVPVDVSLAVFVPVFVVAVFVAVTVEAFTATSRVPNPLHISILSHDATIIRRSLPPHHHHQHRYHRFHYLPSFSSPTPSPPFHHLAKATTIDHHLVSRVPIL